MRKLIFTLLVVVLIVAGLGFYLGWLHFGTERDREGNLIGVRVDINRGKIRNDTQTVRKEAGNLGRKVKEGAEEASEAIRHAPSSLTGDVTAIHANESRLTVRTADGRLHDVAVTGTTRIRRNEVSVPLNQLMAGDRVVVSYRQENGRPVAESITVQQGS